MAAPGNGGNGGNGRPTKSSGFPLFKKSAAPPPAAPAPNAPRPSASRLNVPPPQAPPAARRSQSPMEIESAPATSTFSFWKNSTQIAKRPVPATPAYIAWYGTLTGDIWHVAAAQILSEYIRSGPGNAHPFPDHEIRTCLTIMADKKYGTAGEAPAAASSAQQAPAAAGSHGHSQEYQYGEAAYGEEWAYGEEAQSESSKISPCVQRGRKSWKYLQAIGLNASLVMVPHRIGSGQVAHANDTLSAEEATTWYVDKPTTFDQALAAWVGYLDRRPPWPQGPGVANDPCLIDLLASTTVVMQMMEYIGYQEARRILGYRLSGGATMGGTREALALQKVYQLCGIIDAVNTNVNNTLQGVVLFNYRIGDVNKQHNASAGILNDVRKAAAAHRYATIVIPQMSSDEYRKHKPAVTTHGRSVSTPALTPYMRSVVFDLLDVDTPVQQPQQGHQPRQGSSQQPAAAAPQFMDDTAKAYFWHLVATFMQGTFSPLGTATGEPPAQLAKALQVQRPPVVGLVGGRSGSTDLPGFVGLRVYSWEEPLLGALHGAEKTTSSGAWSSTYYNIQGPQATRLFNQQPIIATGWLSMEGFVKKGKSREYTNLNVSDGFLNEWLGGGEVGIPRLPDDASKKFLEDFFRKNVAKISTKEDSTSSSTASTGAGSLLKGKASTSRTATRGPRVRPGNSLNKWNAAVRAHRPRERTEGRAPAPSQSSSSSRITGHPYAVPLADQPAQPLVRRPAAPPSGMAPPYGTAPPRSGPGPGPSAAAPRPRPTAPGSGRGAPGPGTQTPARRDPYRDPSRD